MKYLIYLTLAFYVQQHLYVNGQEDAMKKAAQHCYTEKKLTADEIKRVENDEYLLMDVKNTPANVICYSLCFYKQLGLLSATGKYDANRLKTAVTALHKGDAKKAETLLKKCESSAQGANECERVFNYEVCLHDVKK